MPMTPIDDPVTVEGEEGENGAGRARWLTQSEWFALLPRSYFRDAVQRRQLLARQESSLNPLTARNAVKT
jgi:hypothetical protein